MRGLFRLLIGFFHFHNVLIASSQHFYYSKTTINNVVIDDGKIYVGAVNKLAVLSTEELLPLHSLTTGPINDSVLCSFDGSSCLKNAVLRDTDNHNKVLQVLPDGVLHCGSVRQGICSMHSLRDLSMVSSGDVPVASISPTASCISLVLSPTRLAVAVSYSGDSPYRDPFPAVAVRELPSYLVLNAGSLEGEAAVFLRAELRLSFVVQYLTIFHHAHYVFIAAVQSQNTRQMRSLPRVTKLLRFCDNDTRFISYSEVELQCRSEDNSNFPHMTAAFIHGDYLVGAFTTSPSGTRSAICLFSMQRLKLIFWYNIDRCRGGADSIGLAHIGRDAKCLNKSRLPLDEETCELGVGGSIEAVEIAVAEVTVKITSLNGLGSPRILLAGTDDGQILQASSFPFLILRLEEYNRRNVGDGRTGFRVQQLFIRDVAIYAILPRGIVSLPLSSCYTTSSCSACISSPDPTCQWCTAVGKCSTAAQCSSSTVNVCPMKNGAPMPASLSIDDLKNISIPINYLPQPDGFSYVCLFGISASAATWTEHGVSCALPSLSMSQMEPLFTELLAVTTSISSHRIVEYNFTVYNCGAFTTCSSCRSSETDCDWCLGIHKCVSRGKCASKEIASECVHIEQTSRSIAIPIGESQEIVFPVAHLDRLPSEQSYSCRVLLNGTAISSKAWFNQSSVKCEAMKLTYPEQLPNITAPLEFLQGNHIIDTTTISIFSCSQLATDCSSCMFVSSLWTCSWCSGRCAHDCLRPSHDFVCDHPQILSFSPSSGPVEGGTEVTIIGRDLGSTMDDVRERVFVAGSRCPVIHYEISRKVVCRVEKGTSAGPLRITVGRTGSRTAESTLIYSFVETLVFSVYPSFAPVSGGTKITVYGQNLDAGSNVVVDVGGVPCEDIVRNSSSSFTCIVSHATTPSKLVQIVVSIDAATMSVPNLFEFRPDPIVSSAYPLVTFRSGGRMVTVEGSNFDSVLSARMFFVSSTTPPFEIVSKLSPCQIQNATLMFCFTPELLPEPPFRPSYTRVVPDPEFVPFKGIRIHQGDQPLILDGSHLNEAAEPQDYKIFIGTERCYVTLVDSRQLVCNGPSTQPEATDDKGDVIVGGLPLVSVTVGRIRVELGLIEYVDPIATLRLWVLVVVALTALSSLLVLLAFLWKKRRLERERDYRKIQMQMEHLESNVRKECKQVRFTEAVLVITLNLCLPLLIGIPLLVGAHLTSFPDFLYRLLWEDNGWPHSPSLYVSTLPVTLAQFDALLSSKQFIFSIVETAESESAMSLGERSMLSSLLIAVLLRNFQYCTDVVLSLLKAHIAKSVHVSAFNILFRKSDSVVEKMVSKWLTICLYDSISQDQIHKYSTLYKALKYQTEKGPVDAVTGSARYTINESKLLREIVDGSYVDCLVTSFDGSGPFAVRAIACDTISQLKQKILDHIFKRTPHSQRPALFRFDLELLCPSRGRLLLSDWSGSPSIKAPTKLNTLAHYGISNQSHIVMVPNEKNSAHYRDSLADSGKSSWTSLDRCSPMYPPSRFFHLTSPSRTLTMERRKKIDESIPKSIPEVYLTRLLTSKGTVQKYIEDFVESVLFAETSGHSMILKSVFDLLDDEAARNGVSDLQLIQQWKSNLYILRVWVHLIKNPKILLDVSESVSQDGNLSVVAQTLMDCFSFSEQTLGAHSPSSRLLFAKEVARLRPLSSDLFRRIRRQPAITEEAFIERLNEVANCLCECTRSTVALSELLTWVRGNGVRLVEVLSANDGCVAQRLPSRLSQVINLSLDPADHIYSTILD
ncbi:hypothetical protein Angca_002229, partial [Angiostrongylus cantonensis]